MSGRGEAPSGALRAAFALGPLLLLGAAVLALAAAPASARFVAVGAWGGTDAIVTTSEDGIEWTESRTLRDVRWANGLWVAVGEAGTIKTSPDGIEWTLRESGTTAALYDVTYAQGLWFIAGYGGTILLSNDGIAWSPLCPGNANCRPGDFGGVVFDGGQWVLIRSNTVGVNANVLTSTGAPWVWTEQNSGSTGYPLNGIGNNGNELVAVGYPWGGAVRTSLDGVVWSADPIASGIDTLNAVASDGADFVTVSNGAKVFSRPVGGPGPWTDVTGTSTAAFQDVRGTGSLWVAVGWLGTIATNTAPLSAWVSQASPTSLGLYSLDVNTAGRWVAVGVNGVIVTSTNAAEWEQVAGSPTNKPLNDVAYGNGLWVAVGTAGEIITSEDAVQWTRRTSGTVQNLEGVASDGTGWVAVGWQGTTVRSPDGITWTPGTVGATTTLRDVAGDGTQWVAVGNSGKTYRSTDGGATWAFNAIPPPNYIIYGIHHAGNRFVATMGPGVLTSPDGVTWTATVLSGSTLYDATNTGPRWIAVGLSGKVHTSVYGDTWPAGPTTGTGVHMYDITTDGEIVVSVGAGGRILTSPPDTVAWAPRDSHTNVELNGVASDIAPPPPVQPPLPGTFFATLTPSASNGYPDTTFGFTASVGSGQTPYTCTWSVAPATATFVPPLGCSGTATLTNGVPGTMYTVTLSATDSWVPASTATATATATVYSTLSATLAASPVWGTRATTFTFTPTVAGGIPSVACTWTIQPPASGFVAPAPSPAACSNPATLSQGAYGTVYTVTLTAASAAPPATSVLAQASVEVSPNGPPTAAYSGPASIAPGQRASFADMSFDPDGALVAWFWEFGDGATSSQSSPLHRFTAPGTYRVRLTVVDDGGAVASVEHDWYVGGAAPAPDEPSDDAAGGREVPVADAGADQFVPEGTRVRLAAIGSPTFAYAWSQVAGPFVALQGAAGPEAAFVAPLLPDASAVTLRFRLDVAAEGVGGRPDFVDVIVLPTGNAPVAVAGGRQEAPSGATVRLDGSATTDPDRDALTFSWSQVDGPRVELADANAAVATFAAPATDVQLVLTFRLVASDGRYTSADVATVVVTPHLAPVPEEERSAPAPRPLVVGQAASADLRPLLVAMAAMAIVGLLVALLVTGRSDRR